MEPGQSPFVLHIGDGLSQVLFKRRPAMIGVGMKFYQAFREVGQVEPL